MSTDILTRKPTNTSISTNPSHSLNIHSTPIPSLSPKECLIHIHSTGICGSDLHFLHAGSIGSSTITKENQILGHESSGTIIALGSQVTRFAVGDRVALENGIPCSKPTCKDCRTGQYHGCPEMVFYSSPPVDGTMRRYHAHPEDWLHKLPDSMSFDEGAMLEPLSVALAGVEIAGVELGDCVLICGAGSVGLMCVLVCEAMGVGRIVVTDVEESRLEVARGLVGRARTVCVGKGEGEEEVAGRIRETVGGGEADVVLECTGVESSVHAAIYATHFAGHIHLIGISPSPTMSLPFMHASFKELTLTFQFRYHETYPKAIRLWQAGLLKGLGSLVSHRFPLEDAREAFEKAGERGGGVGKVVVFDE